MKTHYVGKFVSILLLSAASLSANGIQETLANLNTAFQGESNAQNRYTLFAKQADTEGYPMVAKLFRAAAKAEGIHRNAHREAIEKLGGTVETFELDAVNIGTSAENLKAAIEGESYERDTMYPEFMAQAIQANARPAIRSIRFALDAEKEHAKLYSNALEQLGKQKDAPIYVCEVCGYTTMTLPEKKCPTCRRPVDESYVVIN